jgi:AcrR family transcriptional regulator
VPHHRGPRARARRGEGGRLRKDILAAAGRLLAETGDQDAVSIRAIADAVGVTPPSIYLHFTSKDELILAVCNERFAEFDRRLEEAGTRGTDLIDSMRRRAHAYVQFGLENPEHYRLLFMTRYNLTPGADDQADLAFAHHVQTVTECIEAGLFHEGDPTLLAISIWSAMHGITSLLIAQPGFPWPDRDRVVGSVLDLILDGALRPRATAQENGIR